MTITFDELRQIKHSLPTGSISRIANQLGVENQTVRNYFGGNDLDNGKTVGIHLEPGPSGGIVHLDDDTILKMALDIIESSKQAVAN